MFCLLLLVSLGVPPLARRLHMPDLVGLLLAGIALGPFGLGWLHRESPVLELLSQVGIVFLLFSAGLELDLGELRRLRRRSLIFGSLTLLIPVVVGVAIGLAYGPLLGGSTVAALLIGALMAAHTPLGYPLLRAYGVLGDEAVTVGLGGTVIADVGSFVLLAICVGLSRGDFDAPDLVALLLRVALYATAVVLLIVSIGGRFLARTGNRESNQFLFVLLALLLAAISAELAGVEHVMGALLAGVAVNAVLPEGLAKDKVLFVGHVLFVPIFFIDLGLLVEVPAFLSNLGSAHLILALIAGVLVSKGQAATLVSLAYGCSGDQLITLWSLSIPHVASTLAAAFVSFRAGLIDSTVLNAMMALMLVTAVVGPYLTQRSGRRLRQQAFEDEGQPLSVEHGGVLAPERTRLRLMVPIANPANERSRLLVGALVGGHDGELLPLVVVPTGGAEPDPLVEARRRGHGPRAGGGGASLSVHRRRFRPGHHAGGIGGRGRPAAAGLRPPQPLRAVALRQLDRQRLPPGPLPSGRAAAGARSGHSAPHPGAGAGLPGPVRWSRCRWRPEWWGRTTMGIPIGRSSVPTT